VSHSNQTLNPNLGQGFESLVAHSLTHTRYYNLSRRVHCIRQCTIHDVATAVAQYGCGIVVVYERCSDHQHCKGELIATPVVHYLLSPHLQIIHCCMD